MKSFNVQMPIAPERRRPGGRADHAAGDDRAGITAMQVTRMEERMAGNSRDVNLAFQGAEAGLRDSEARIAG